MFARSSEENGHAIRLGRTQPQRDGNPIGQRPPAELAPEELSRCLQVVRDAAARVGRDPRRVGVAFRAPLSLRKDPEPAGRRLLTGAPGQVVDDIKSYRDVGVSHMVFDVLTNDAAEIEGTMERFAHGVQPHIAWRAAFPRIVKNRRRLPGMQGGVNA